MQQNQFPVIDPVATVCKYHPAPRGTRPNCADLQEFFGFERAAAIYKWQRGKSLPSVDNLYSWLPCSCLYG
jgi:hypothetical protein